MEIEYFGKAKDYLVPLAVTLPIVLGFAIYVYKKTRELKKKGEERKRELNEWRTEMRKERELENCLRINDNIRIIITGKQKNEMPDSYS